MHKGIYLTTAALLITPIFCQSCVDTGVVLLPGGPPSLFISQITGSSCSGALTYGEQNAIPFNVFEPPDCGSDVTIQAISLDASTPTGSAILTLTCQTGQVLETLCSLITISGSPPVNASTTVNQISLSCGSVPAVSLLPASPSVPLSTSAGMFASFSTSSYISLSASADTLNSPGVKAETYDGLRVARMGRSDNDITIHAL
jgi:hypothetical protein